MRFKLNRDLGSQWTSLFKQHSWVRSLLDRFRPAKTPASPDYETWRHRFFLSRLGLCLRLAVIILLSFVARDVYNSVFPLEELQDIPAPLKTLWVPIDLTLGLCLLLCIVLHRTPLGRKYPAIPFLGLSWSVTITPQLWATLAGFPLSDILAWSLVFLIQATLIPVRWELHFVSQLGLLVYFYGVNSLLGLTAIPAPLGQPEQSIFMFTVFLYLFWFCFICDLSVYLYERLQQAEFESRRQAQLFLHAVSHDLRNPVMGSSLVLSNLLKKSSDTVTVPRSYLERMIDSSDRQLRLINSLLEVHTSEVGGMALNQQPLILHELVQGVVSDLEPLLHENRVQIDRQISETLPLVNVDSTQLWRVFCNLIANALHHNAPGITLTLSAQLESGMVRCGVQDNGVGMTEVERDRVFDLYARGAQAQRSVGLGLGLYLCRLIITAHGGQIGVISTPGAGATFWFTLPIASV